MTPETKTKLMEARMKAKEAKKKVIENGEEYAPPEYNPLIQAINAPKSKAKAIKAKCGECMGCTKEHVEPSWRTAVRECTSYDCPLHSHRPYKGL
jgi:hypothetical protein